MKDSLDKIIIWTASLSPGTVLSASCGTIYNTHGAKNMMLLQPPKVPSLAPKQSVAEDTMIARRVSPHLLLARSHAFSYSS